MHYLVDGYNLLFKTAWGQGTQNLERARSLVIRELESHASFLNLHLTVVFDAPLQSEELQRGHFHSLEIIFTAKGQTADDYLHDYVSRAQKKVVVVTSDKTLARKVKALGAYVESVHDFLHHLRKKSQNKLAKSQKQPQVLRKEIVIKKQPPSQKQESLPPLGDLEAWKIIFEERFKHL